MQNNYQGNAYGIQSSAQPGMYYNIPMHYPTQYSTDYLGERDMKKATDKEKVDFLRRCSSCPLFRFLLDHLENSCRNPRPLVKWTRKHGWEMKVETREFALEWGKREEKKVTFCRINRTLGQLPRCGGHALMERHEKLGTYRFFGGHNEHYLPFVPEHELSKVDTVVKASARKNRHSSVNNRLSNPLHFGAYPPQGQQPSWPQMSPYGQISPSVGPMRHGTRAHPYAQVPSMYGPAPYPHSLPPTYVSAPPPNQYSLTPSFTSVFLPNQHSLVSDYVSPLTPCSLTSDFSSVSPSNTHTLSPSPFASCAHSPDGLSNHSTPSPSDLSLIPSDMSASSGDHSLSPSFSDECPLPVIDGDVSEFFGLSTPSGSAAVVDQTGNASQTVETPEVPILPLEQFPTSFEDSILDSLLPEDLSTLFEDSHLDEFDCNLF